MVTNKNPQMPKGYFKPSVSTAGFISPFILLSHYRMHCVNLLYAFFMLLEWQRIFNDRILIWPS